MFKKLFVSALLGIFLLFFSSIGWSEKESSSITPQRYILKETEIVAKTGGAFGYIVFDTATGVIYKWITVGNYGDNKQNDYLIIIDPIHNKQITVNQNK